MTENKNIFISVITVKDNKRIIPQIYEIHWKGLEAFAETVHKYMMSGWSERKSGQIVLDWLENPDNEYPREINDGVPLYHEVKFTIINDQRKLDNNTLEPKVITNE